MGSGSFRARLRQAFPAPSSPELTHMARAWFISGLGSTVAYLTFSYLAFATTKSALAAVLVSVSFSVGYGAFAVTGGVVARHFDIRRVVVWATVGKLLVYGAALAAALADSLDLTVILAVTFLGGVTGSIQFPSWQELLRRFTAAGRMDETNALFSSANYAATFIGALAGGALLDLLGAAPILAFNLVTFLPLLFILVRLPAGAGDPAPPDETDERTASIPEAWVAIRKSAAVRRAIVFVALLQMLAWPVVSLMPKVAAEVGSGARIYGLLLAAFYLGAALVVLLLRRMKARHRYNELIWFATALSGLALAVAGAVGAAPLGLVPTLAILFLLFGAIGLALSSSQSILGAIVQLGVPRRNEGDVLGVLALVALVFGTLGSLVEGVLADRLDVWWLPLASGALVFALLLAVWSRHGFLPLNEQTAEIEGVHRQAVKRSERYEPGSPAPLAAPVHGQAPAADRSNG